MNTNLEILLVEDDTDDIELLDEALRDNNIAFTMKVITHGDKVLPYLKEVNGSPDIIILDYNIPRLHGREILHLIKSSESFSNIPVIVMTTSAAREDMDYALKMGAIHFITKPTSIEDFNATVSTIIKTAGH
ncbi:MAG: response regulator [Ferruginibacter sp.]